MNTVYFLFISFFIPVQIWAQIPDYLISKNWDNKNNWILVPLNDSSIRLNERDGINHDGIEINYQLSPGRREAAWVRMFKKPVTGFTPDHPIVLLIKAEAYDDIELKFIDRDGSVFLKRYTMNNRYKAWTHIVIYLDDTQYGWGGNQTFDTIDSFEIAFSGDSSGTVWMDEIGIGQPDLISGCFLDPYRDSDGYGFQQRRAEEMSEEDVSVLDYLTIIQDYSSPAKMLLTNDEKTTLVSTFNSGLAAMAFTLKGQKERAERILNFYAAAVDSNNQDINVQNFFYNGMARGFYQQMNITDYQRGGGIEDRWIGDMAWLLLAFKYYQQTYGVKPAYDKVITLIKDLLISFYKDVDEDCGCIQTGWQDGDTRFDTSCHHEGNIDCYAVFKLCGEDFFAQKVKIWLERELSGKDLPLDTYTWRVLAFDEPAPVLCNIPEYDMQYRKKYFFGQDSIYGFYPFADIDVTNIWTEGTGHMACAQLFYGDTERGYFYANQLDPLLLNYNLYGRPVKTLPYAVNQSGDFSWIDPDIGTVSSAAWYIFAKNAFNPLALKVIAKNGSESSIPATHFLYQNYPNPFNTNTKIKFFLPGPEFVRLEVYNLAGQQIASLIHAIMNSGIHEIDFSGRHLPSGIYFYRLEAGKFISVRKMTLVK